MKNKKIFWSVICGFAVILVLFFAFGGFEFSIYGVCSFNTKYYNTPKTAFLQNETIDFTIEKDIGIVEIDSHNVMYIAKTSDCEILVAQMKQKNNEYYFVGYYSLFSDDSFQENNSDTPSFEQNCMYKEDGWFKANFEYAILKQLPQQKLDGYKCVALPIDSQQNIYFLYRIITN